MNDIWSKDDLKYALILKATDTHSSFIENFGKGHFTIKLSPLQSREAPVYLFYTEIFPPDICNYLQQTDK